MSDITPQERLELEELADFLGIRTQDSLVLQLDESHSTFIVTNSDILVTRQAKERHFSMAAAIRLMTQSRHEVVNRLKHIPTVRARMAALQGFPDDQLYYTLIGQEDRLGVSQYDGAAPDEPHRTLTWQLLQMVLYGATAPAPI